MNDRDEHKWASVFIEIALRAVRRIHYEYGLWGIGPQWDMSREKAARINTGLGIELAYETDVCAAITQEIMGSPAVAGLWSEDAGNGTQKKWRYFMIDRETTYLSDGEKNRVDIFLQKFEPKGNKPGEELVLVPPPAFIEAKRARRWIADITTGEVTSQRSQLSDIKADVKKLRDEIDHRAKGNGERIFGHVLVWGLYGRSLGSDHPVKFFKKLDGVRLHALRWLPLDWDRPSFGTLGNPKLLIPKVHRALWIGLAEVLVGGQTST